MVSAPLKLIRGRVQELAVSAGEEQFIGSQAHRTAGAGAALGLAAAGMAGAAVGASMAATGRDSVEFFDCMVDGQRVSGRFSKVTFKDGDEVEVVIEPQWDGTQSALAVRRLSDRILWMFPHCSRGMLAHRAFSRRLFGWLVLGFMLFSGLFIVIMEWSSAESTNVRFLEFVGTLYAGLSLVAALYGSIRFFAQWKPMALQAEAIFAALGYREPSRVDLENDHKRACMALGKKWPYSSDGPWIYRYPEET
jgi:hypothetical protein